MNMRIKNFVFLVFAMIASVSKMYSSNIQSQSTFTVKRFVTGTCVAFFMLGRAQAESVQPACTESDIMEGNCCYSTKKMGALISADPYVDVREAAFYAWTEKCETPLAEHQQRFSPYA